MAKITTLGFDADDTLWHNERVFRLTEERFASLLGDYTDKDHLAERLLAAENAMSCTTATALRALPFP